MARTAFQMNCRDPFAANYNIEQILKKNGYTKLMENGEYIWKCGTGATTAVKYIKIEFSSASSYTLYGWIRPFGGDEQNLDGFIGGYPKKQILDLLQQIQITVHC